MVYKPPKTRIIETVYSDGTRTYIPQYRSAGRFLGYWEFIDEWNYEIDGLTYSTLNRAKIRVDEFLRSCERNYHNSHIVKRSFIDYP